MNTATERTISRLVGVLAVSLAVCGTAAGQGAEGPSGQDQPLSGPKVPDRTGKPTLVERGADGKVVRLEEWPTLAAVRKLKLDDAAKEAVRKIELEQAAAMDKFMSENLLEVARLAAAFEAGNVTEGLAGVRKLQKDHPVLEMRSRLSQTVGKVLSKEQDAELRAMIGEYWSALVAEEEGEAKARGERASPGKVASGEALRLLGQDIKASYQRVIGQRVRAFDEFVAGLGLEGEQEQRVRKVVQDAFTRAGGNEKKMDKASVFWAVWRELTPAQRDRLVDSFKGGKGG